MYLTLNAAELAKLSELLSDDHIVSAQLSRRDSLDNLHAEGFLIVSIVDGDGDQYRVAITDTGWASVWS